MTVKSSPEESPAKRRRRRGATVKPSPSSVTLYRVVDAGSPNDPQNEREFIGTQPLPLPDGSEIFSWLQQTAGPGHYRLEYRDDKGRVIEVVPAYIGSPLQQETQGVINPPLDVERIVERKLAASLPRQNPPSSSLTEMVSALQILDEMRAKNLAPPKDGIQEFVGHMQAIEQVRRFLIPKESNPHAIETEKEITTEAALIRLISEDPLTLAAAREKLLGSDGESSSWLTILPTLAPHLTAMVSEISNTIKAFASGSQQPQMEIASIAQDTPASSNPTADASNERADVQAYGRVMRLILSSMAINGDVKPSVNKIDSFVDIFPEHGEMIYGLMSQPAEVVFTFIEQSFPEASQAVKTPHAVEWMQKLQAEYLKEEENPEPAAKVAG